MLAAERARRLAAEKAAARCSWSASTSGWRAPCSATWPMRRRAPAAAPRQTFIVCVELLRGRGRDAAHAAEPHLPGMVQRDAAHRLWTQPSTVMTMPGWRPVSSSAAASAIGTLESLQLLLRDQDHGVFCGSSRPGAGALPARCRGAAGAGAAGAARGPPQPRRRVARLGGPIPVMTRGHRGPSRGGLPPSGARRGPGAATVGRTSPDAPPAPRRGTGTACRSQYSRAYQPAVQRDVLRRRIQQHRPLEQGHRDEGRSKGLPARGSAWRKPDDVVLFEAVRRFKGLEREVIVLCELPEGGRTGSTSCSTSA